MFRRTISLITLTALMVNMMGLTGCTVARRPAKIASVSAEKARLRETGVGTKTVGGPIVAVHTKDGVVIFAGEGKIDPRTSAVVGYTPSNEYVSIPLEDVTSFEVRRVYLTPYLWAYGTVAVIAGISKIVGNISGD